MLPTTTTLSPEDRTKLSLLFRTRGDAVSFATLREEDPLETLAWLSEPHIKPWHDAIRAAHREHEQTETHLALARALKDITRILDLEADSTLRIRAVNAIIKLANAIQRGSKSPSPRSEIRRGESAIRRGGAGLGWVENFARSSADGPNDEAPPARSEFRRAADALGWSANSNSASAADSPATK